MNVGLHKEKYERTNARGKPRRSAKHGGHPQAELVGVGLTNRLGWEAEMR